MKHRLTGIIAVGLILTSCDAVLGSVIRPDMGSYESPHSRVFGDQDALKIEAERLGKTGTAEYTCRLDSVSWMAVDTYGGEAMVANTVIGLTDKYNYLPCSTTGSVKTCKAGEMNQVFDLTTGNVTFTEDGTDFELTCTPGAPD